MRWNVEDMQTFESAKEFVDSAIIPVYAYSVNNVSLRDVQEQKWLEEVCLYAERQLMGRVLLFPTLYVIDQLNPFQQAIHSEQFRHVLFVACNEELVQQLQAFGHDVYALPRHDREDEIAVIVKHGKWLSQEIMNRWKIT